jgi:5-methylcytosine-specific restriction endonuclease McrA
VASKAQRARQKRWLTKRRNDWIDSQGRACVDCGTDQDLEIDHVDPRTKAFEIGRIWSRKQEFREAELAKCVLRCTTHHRLKTAEDIKAGLYKSP